ncbi:MAG: FG-GAP repeat protein [Acidobacteria bacterium]|nr:FG-GAP repeat protein [Acidobacteriota bacterium]
MQRLPLAILCAAPLLAQIRGGALVEKPRPLIITWGDRLQAWPLNGGPHVTLLSGTNFGPGGCATDVDGDGRDDLLIQGRPGTGPFLWLRAPDWKASVIEEETEFKDCLPFSMEGRRGVLIPHVNAQLRFYLFPSFQYKELYSIYTNSRQGGLLAHDVDGDGLDDLFVGNYWMRNPGRLGVAWRLFAINVWHDTPSAALAALGLWRNGALVWAESEAERARIAVFSPPADRKQLWEEHRLAPLDRPRAVLVHPAGVFIGHASGVVLETPEAGGWRRTDVATGFEALKLIRWKDGVWAVTPQGVRRLPTVRTRPSSRRR